MLQILRSPEITIETTRPAVRPRPVRRHMVTTIAKARHQPRHVRADLRGALVDGGTDPQANLGHDAANFLRRSAADQGRPRPARSHLRRGARARSRLV